MKMELAFFLGCIVSLGVTFTPSPRFLHVQHRSPPESFRLTPLALSTADFKNGLTIIDGGQPVKIMEFLHVKPGKGSAFVRTKLKNLITGNTNEKTWRAGESVEKAEVQKEELQFSYKEDVSYVFMSMETFETVEIDAAVIGDRGAFVKEGLDVSVLKFDGKIIDLELPKTVEYQVTMTDPGLKGDTAKGGGTKPATLESGAVIQVPLFVNEGDVLKVDPMEKRYISRA